MIIKTRCKCGHTNQSEISMEWAKDGSMMVHCAGCSEIYLASMTVDTEEQPVIETTITPEPKDEAKFVIASRVVINNKDSEIHDQEGIIVDKDYMHYKIQLDDGRAIWLPHHWIVLKKSP